MELPDNLNLHSLVKSESGVRSEIRLSFKLTLYSLAKLANADTSVIAFRSSTRKPHVVNFLSGDMSDIPLPDSSN